MIKVAVYGKGGIGKSTTVSNLAAVYAESGMTVMQIGCDPKADSTMNLHGLEKKPTVLELIREKGKAVTLEEMVTPGYGGVLCVEAGGPVPGMGCAGRGIIAALETLEEKDAFQIYQPDIVLYDVLGDVVCGGFAMPIREGYAEKVFVVTSGENMAIYAAANIAMAVDNLNSFLAVIRDVTEALGSARSMGILLGAVLGAKNLGRTAPVRRLKTCLLFRICAPYP